jgi:hypothetical protein
VQLNGHARVSGDRSSLSAHAIRRATTSTLATAGCAGNAGRERLAKVARSADDGLAHFAGDTEPAQIDSSQSQQTDCTSFRRVCLSSRARSAAGREMIKAQRWRSAAKHVRV